MVLAEPLPSAAGCLVLTSLASSYFSEDSTDVLIWLEFFGGWWVDARDMNIHD
jgi:hypothetical protein